MSNNDLQPLKGFRDFLPHEARKRDYLLNLIKQSFALYGFEPLETPALETQNVLLGKYGSETDKLIYTFTDQGNRPVGLRYDQTVPTARVIAANKNSLTFPFKRYQTQTVWRAEKPQKGRFREFLQCDIDIFGTTSPLADAEIIASTLDAAKNLGFTNLKMLINSRNNLVTLINQANIDPNLSSTIIQTIDKLDKLPESTLKNELIAKGLTPSQTDLLFKLISNAKPDVSLQQIITLLTDNMGIPGHELVFSPTLARGLDYYTGAIFELICPDYTGGSIAGGGRYDHLINQLSGLDVPAVGLAFGFDRTLEAMEELNLFAHHLSGAKVLVTIFSPQLLQTSISLAASLRSHRIPTELYLNPQDKIQKQLKYADRKAIPYVAIIGDQELKNNTITLKNMAKGTQETASISQLVDLLI